MLSTNIRQTEFFSTFVVNFIGFTYTYRESGGNHTWKVWRLYLAERSPKFFR